MSFPIVAEIHNTLTVPVRVLVSEDGSAWMTCALPQSFKPPVKIVVQPDTIWRGAYAFEADPILIPANRSSRVITFAPIAPPKYGDKDPTSVPSGNDNQPIDWQIQSGRLFSRTLAPGKKYRVVLARRADPRRTDLMSAEVTELE